MIDMNIIFILDEIHCSGGIKFCFTIDNIFVGRTIVDFSVTDWIKEKKIII